ncbi:uncharacterized protein LOC135476161 [Liolophura sinensis]|uniref:uncharacterized protein LOC135476161 n=1 Tax=Liolophura sinensis TaxID=3198878 RepID=UPI0031592675
MDSCLLNRFVPLFSMVLLLPFADAATSPTGSPPTRADPDKITERDNVYLSGGKNNISVEEAGLKILPSSEIDRKDNESSPAPQTNYIFKVNNSSTHTNGSDSSTGGKDMPLNLAIIPVLAGFFIVTFVCIKCCNRVKADVIKDRDLYIEDGKPLFRVEPESHKDYLSSIGSGYNAYSTVTSGYNAYSTVGSGYNAYSTVQTSGYNPYNTVTTMMSDVSTMSETKDAGTMVKPRDIWKTMRQARGSSVPDFSQDRNLLGTVAEEVKRFKNKNSLSPAMNSVMYPRSPRSSPRTRNSTGRPQSSTSTEMRKKPFRSADDLLDSKAANRSIVKAEVENHRESPHPTAEETHLEESQALLGPGDDGSTSCPNRQSSPETLSPIVLVNDVKLKDDSQRPSSQTSTCSSSESSTPEGPGDRTPRSRLRSSGKTKALNVTFEDAVADSKTNPPKTRSPRSSPIRPFSGKYVEIPRKPSSKGPNVRRKFSLTVVDDDNNPPTAAASAKVSAGTDTETDSRPNDPLEQNSAAKKTKGLVKQLPCHEIVVKDNEPSDDSHRERPTNKEISTSNRPPSSKDSTDSEVPNGVLASGIAAANNTLVLPALSCH